MRLVVGAATDVGRVREVNEDSYLVDEAMGLYAIADGVGGHQAGEVASSTALEALRAAVRSGKALRDAIEEANDAVYAKSLADDDLRGMGTTVTAATLAAGNTLLVGHVGDSRAYMLRDGDLRQLTTDHSRVQELVDTGHLTAEEAAVHPMRNIITRAIGMDETVEVDVYPVELRVGDRVLFCSDGLTDMLHDDFLGTELRREDDPSRAATRLVDAANRAGGVDNITVLVLGVVDEDPVAAEWSPPVATESPAAVDADRDLEPSDAAPRPSRRRTVVRVLLWTIPILVVFGVAIGAVAWYARNQYYVAPSDGQIVVYRGVPGGLLWWDPTVDRRTDLRVDELRPADADRVRDEPTFSSEGDANAYVRRIAERATAATTTTSPNPTTTTSTTTPVPAGQPPTTALTGP
jgi:protein phosphatase